MRKEYQVELNGYSNYIKEEVHVGEAENFTLTFVCAPYTYETGVSGILSAYSGAEKQGLLVGVKKRGIVTVKLGLDRAAIEIESLKGHLNFQKLNVVTIAFWGTAGWCDLYVNGVLSNRKQFPRHSKVRFPKKECYVGKYVDEITYFSDSRFGNFHGKLNMIDFLEEYQDHKRVEELYQEFCELYKREINLSNVQSSLGQSSADDHCECIGQTVDLYATQDFSQDIYRPVYHLMPPGKWMNEPHAPFFYKGNYHIFYQANPHAPVWDNLCWGHLVSEDMVGWKDAGIALYPDEENIDIDGCWSGSACLDENGDPLLFYTAGNNKELPNQGVAVAHPENTDDPKLRKWVKDGVVLRQTLGMGFLGEFRDPFVWRKNDTYYCLVGSGDENNGGGNALVYTSTDLKTFTCHGFVTEYDYEQCEEVGHVWELPVLLPLNNEKGEYCCDILLLCACQIEKEVVETYYFLGKFDYEKKKFHKFHEYPHLVDLGCGTFTGPSGFVTPDGRSVVFTIAQGKRKPQDEYASGWAHNGGMPIELWMKENTLCITPVSEAKRYFSKCIVLQEIQSQNFGTRVFLAENLLEHRLCLTSEGSYAELILQWEDDGYRISYDRRTKEWRTLSLKQNTMISKIRNEEDLVDIGKEDIKIECFIDHSMIELYLNDRKGMTLRSYPFCEKNKLYVKTDGICSVSVWEYDKNAD